MPDWLLFKFRLAEKAVAYPPQEIGFLLKHIPKPTDVSGPGTAAEGCELVESIELRADLDIVVMEGDELAQ